MKKPPKLPVIFTIAQLCVLLGENGKPRDSRAVVKWLEGRGVHIERMGSGTVNPRGRFVWFEELCAAIPEFEAGLVRRLERGDDS
jgi:hypothetical protein